MYSSLHLAQSTVVLIHSLIVISMMRTLNLVIWDFTTFYNHQRRRMLLVTSQ